MNAARALQRYRAYQRGLEARYASVANHPYPDDDPAIQEWRANHSGAVMADLAAALEATQGGSDGSD